MIDLRCKSHLHAQLDEDHAILVVKCRHCTIAQSRKVFHSWPITNIIERARAT